MTLKEFIEKLNAIEDKDAEVMIADSEWGTESLFDIKYKKEGYITYSNKGYRLPPKSCVILQ